ncbi:FimV/HubP family polar landmark protein [Marinobacter confluentis]|uniref:FimV N-terminal domain-containing protein n=1 Tax=Marinobacter confluentis TaxID=1697557 RepID=A0A4Z1CBV6_9GAMM|nr:FimV/HubP family polar landmark protein [Marinobacter confluentis]TGN41586.1 hypothetical protein E5Q11_03385 [Marinobacter confluentis]
MKVRKLAVALALAGGLGSGVAQALGLGEIELQSYLNEPLDAEINLRKSEGVSPGDVFVNIAPQSAFERVGIERSYFLTRLNFEVTTAPNGSLVVNISTREPLREPYLNFLVEVTWPNGRLMREYAVLVDPPVYAEESGIREQVSAPASSASGQSSQPRQQARQPEPARTTRSTQSVSMSGARTLGPTDSSDTLWTIAAQVRPNNNVSMQQTMLAIQDLNPDAFIDDNINRLKRGEILRIPDENQIRSRSRSEANQEVAVQNRAFSTPRSTVDATADSAGSGSDEAAGGSGGDQLRLLAADDTESRDTSDGGSAGGDGDTAGGVDAGSAVAMEELESARRENEELTGRVDDLQDQVQTLQRLLELKNSQLADLQNTQGEPTASGSPEAGMAADDSSASADDTASAEGTEATDGMDGVEGAGMDDASADSDDMAAGDAAQDAESQDQASESDSMSDEATGTEGAGAGTDGGMTADDAAQSADETDDAAAPAAEQSEPEVAEQPETEAAPAESAQKSFPGNIIDAISSNPMYQIALGGGLVVLLLLLLLLARRNANREKAFYDQLNNETDGEETDSFDLTFDEESDGVAPDDDAIAEADAYIAYGRHDQAAQTLETAISREPSRSDLRLKLLGVYADTQDRESFDKQFREIEALDDEAATEEAQTILNRLEEDESMPSIDDLESQLMSGGSYEDEQDENDVKGSSFQSDSEYDIEAYEAPEGDDIGLDEDESPERALDSDAEDTESLTPARASDDDRDDPIEFDLSDLEDTEEKGSESEEPFDFSLEEGDLPEGDKDDEDDLSLDFETSDLELDDKALPGAEDSDGLSGDLAETPEKAPESDDRKDDKAESLDVDDDGELDESFLDELDAELDKVAGEDDLPEDGDESELDDLELDVSDEDLALMEEFSETDEANPSDAPKTSEDDDLSLDDELGLEDTLSGEEPADPEQEVEGAEQADEMLSEDGPVDPPVASDPSATRDSGRDIQESDLGDDDDFDFLAGTDEAATKLDLARAYVEMGDVDGARDILEEVALEGNEEQKIEAQELLKNLS